MSTLAWSLLQEVSALLSVLTTVQTTHQPSWLYQTISFTFNLQSYATKYENALQNATDISAYLKLMYWDSVFAVTKGITCYSLLHILTKRYAAEWPAYTVPIHAALNLIENLFTVLALKRFQRGNFFKLWLVPLPIITTTKWALAAVNTGSIPLLTVYRGIQTLVAWEVDFLPKLGARDNYSLIFFVGTASICASVATIIKKIISIITPSLDLFVYITSMMKQSNHCYMYKKPRCSVHVSSSRV